MPDGATQDPRRLGDVLPRVLDGLRPADTRRGPTPAGVGGVFGRWTEAVGDLVAAHVNPVKVDGSILVVLVDEAAWATQLQFLESGLLDRLAEVAGVRFDRLEIRVSGARSRGRGVPRNSV